MAPTVRTATWRVVWQYTVSGVAHKLQAYLDCVASADTSGYDTVPRAGYNPAGVSTLQDTWWQHIKGLFRVADTAFDNFTLYHWITDHWDPIWGASAATTPTGSTNYLPAWMFTWSGKSTNGRSLPVYLYESPGTPVPAKYTSFAALPAAYQGVVNSFYNYSGAAIDTDPWAWRMGKGKHYTQRWIAFIGDTNEKLRRVRGLK